MTDRELLELIAAQVSKLTTQVEILTKDMAGVKDIVIKIENDHGQKLGALLNGYKQNAERLDRIEKEVAKHEEIILRRIN